MSYSTNMVYLYFHFKMNCEVVDSGWIYTTGSGETKTLHHSVTSKMGRKASKMVTHTQHLGVLSDSSHPAHTSASPKRSEANIFKCSERSPNFRNCVICATSSDFFCIPLFCI